MSFFKTPFFLFRSQQWALWVVIELLLFVFYYRQHNREKAPQPLDKSITRESKIVGQFALN